MGSFYFGGIGVVSFGGTGGVRGILGVGAGGFGGHSYGTKGPPPGGIIIAFGTPPGPIIIIGTGGLIGKGIGA